MNEAINKKVLAKVQTWPDWQKEIVSKHPYLFRHIIEESKHGHYGIAWGIEHGSGWAKLLDETLTKIEQIKPDAKIHQIKEKFGGLRIYLARTSNELESIIEASADIANHTCEGCSAEGKIRHNMWIRVLCDICQEQYTSSLVGK